MFDSFGYSNFLIDRYVSLFGKNEAKELVRANQSSARRAIRINTLKVKRGDCVNRLKRQGFKLSQVPWCKNGFFVDKKRKSLAATTEYMLGYYYIQDASSMLPAEALNPREEDMVLDMAAAPGGKTTHISQLMNNQGIVAALDINREKMQGLRSNIQRLDVRNVAMYRMDAKDAGDLGVKFSKILVDAPCSGSGTIMKNPERKKITQKDIDHYSSLQKELFSKAVKLLKKNGELVYSTCSLEPEENEEIVEWALNKFKLSLIPVKARGVSRGLTRFFGASHSSQLSKCVRFYPHVQKTQGFFLAKFKKN